MQFHFRLVHLPNVHRWHCLASRRDTAYVQRPHNDRKDSLHLRRRYLLGFRRHNHYSVHDHARLLLKFTGPPNRESLRPYGILDDRKHLSLRSSVWSPVLRPMAYRYPTRNVLDTLCCRLPSVRTSLLVSLRSATNAPYDPKHATSLESSRLPSHAYRNGGFSPRVQSTVGTPYDYPHGGVTFQGLGWMVSFTMDTMYLHRLVQWGLPAPNFRPGMFIPVGPPSFTSVALIGIANALPRYFDYFATHPLALPILQTTALFAAIFLWSLVFWFFCIALISVLCGLQEMSFRLTWWALVFPNVGFTIATISIGEELNSQGTLWIGSAMTILLVVMWIFLMVLHAMAVFTKQIMMPGLDEDKGTLEHNSHCATC